MIRREGGKQSSYYLSPGQIESDNEGLTESYSFEYISKA